MPRDVPRDYYDAHRGSDSFFDPHGMGYWQRSQSAEDAQLPDWESRHWYGTREQGEAGGVGGPGPLPVRHGTRRVNPDRQATRQRLQRERSMGLFGGFSAVAPDRAIQRQREYQAEDIEEWKRNREFDASDRYPRPLPDDYEQTHPRPKWSRYKSWIGPLRHHNEVPRHNRVGQLLGTRKPRQMHDYTGARRWAKPKWAWW